VKVKQQRHVSPEAAAALAKALPYANFDAGYIEQVLEGFGWAVWNVGNLCWVLTMVNTDKEIEVLLAGGSDAKNCFGPWEKAMLAEPAHRGMTIRVDGRKGWRRYLKNWDCDANGVLTKRVE
jgi:hypothetical protein